MPSLGWISKIDTKQQLTSYEQQCRRGRTDAYTTQCTSVSGMYLRISAKRMAMPTNEARKSKHATRSGATGPGYRDTSSPLQELYSPNMPALACASQVVLSADRSSPKTPEAPKTRVAIPISVATIPDDAFCPLERVDWTATLPSLPISDCT